MANKRDQILRSAEKIIALERVQNLSMQKFADDAKVAAGTIYRYFEGKDELISELRISVLQSVAAFIFRGTEAGTLEQRFNRLWFMVYGLWFNFVTLGSQRAPQQLDYQQFHLLPGVNTDEHRVIASKTFKPLEDK